MCGNTNFQRKFGIVCLVEKSLLISVITFMKITLLNTINFSLLYKISSELKATYPDLLLLVQLKS